MIVARPFLFLQSLIDSLRSAARGGHEGDYS
jgi:hypothetical protein